MNINVDDLKEIKFKIKRAWLFSFLFLIIILLLISLACFIELKIKVNNNLPGFLDTIIPIFYGVISFIAFLCLLFVEYNIVSTQIKYKDFFNSEIFLKIEIILSYFLPSLFCYLIIHYIMNGKKERKVKNKKTISNKIPYSLIIEPNQAYQDQNGEWWYKDTKGNYFKANQNNQWEKIK